MYTDSPAGPYRAMFRRLVAVPEALFQPWEPRLTGTRVSIALPSWETIGPASCARTTPGTPANLAARPAALALSALVSPDGRSYTTTAVKMLGDWIFDCRFRTWVDSALAGSQDDESFFSAPVSLPDNGPARATMISQKTTTPHLARRPLAKVMMARARLMVIPRQVTGRAALLAALWGTTRREVKTYLKCERLLMSGRP